jgi:hypothetical protein
MKSTRLNALVIAALLSACGGDAGTGPGRHTPELGTYSYTFQPTGPGLAPPPITGTLVITYAAADSIAGTMYSADLERRTSLGFFNVDAYVLDVFGHSTSQVGLLIHRISVEGSSRQLSCSGIHRSGNVSYPSPCTLSFLSGSTAPIITPIGFWSGDLAGVNISMRLRLSGQTVTGEGLILGSGLLANLAIQGTFTNPAIALTITPSSFQPFTFTGTVSILTMAGTVTGSGFTGQQLTLTTR